jgi:branched-chain amino acid transport system ATP-binding protein
MEGISMMMIEHRLRELFRLTNRLVVLTFGQKIAEGTAEEVMSNQQVRDAYLGTETKK